MHRLFLNFAAWSELWRLHTQYLRRNRPIITNQFSYATSMAGWDNNAQFDFFSVILGWEEPFVERRKPFHGGLTAASLLPTSSKSFLKPWVFFLKPIRTEKLSAEAYSHQLRKPLR